MSPRALLLAGILFAPPPRSCATPLAVFTVNATATAGTPPPLNESQATRIAAEVSGAVLTGLSGSQAQPQVNWRLLPQGNAVRFEFVVGSLETSLAVAAVLRDPALNSSSVRTGISLAASASPPASNRDCVSLPLGVGCVQTTLLLAIALVLGIAVGLCCYKRYLLQLARTRVVPIRERFCHRPSVVALADEFKHLFTASNHPIKFAWK